MIQLSSCLALIVSMGLAPPALSRAAPVSPEYNGNCQAPLWARDGSRLSFEVNYHDQKRIELYILTPGQGSPTAVRPVARGASAITAGFSTSSDDMVAHELSWAPADFGRFVYSASGPDRDYDLYLDGSGALFSSPGADGGPSWSPDGRYIAFTSARTGQGDIYVMDVNDIAAAPRRLTFQETSAELFISWAPDSRSIAFVGHDDNGDNIYLLDMEQSSNPTLLTGWGHTQTRPSFSPDGQKVAFYSNHQDSKRFDLYVLSLGGEPSLLVEGVVMNSRGPTWTPDGNHLVFVLDDDDRFDPVCAISTDSPGQWATIASDTIGNGDLDVTTGTDGRLYLAVAAQGLGNDQQRDFKRIYVMGLDKLP